MRTRDSQISRLHSLADSLKIRHFNDEEKFLEAFGEELHQKFFGMSPIVNAFLEEYENICRRLNQDRYKKRYT